MEDEVQKAIRLIKERYEGLENVSISSAGGGFYVVGLGMGGMALSDTFRGGKDFIENIEPLFFKLRTMVKEVKRQEVKRTEETHGTTGTGLLG